MQSEHWTNSVKELPLLWENKPRLLKAVESRRPRSLEMVKHPRNESKFLPGIEKGETAEKQFALVVHRLKKSRRLHKRKKSMKSQSKVCEGIIRPLTWGPNGSKFVEFWDFLDLTLNIDYDLDSKSNSTLNNIKFTIDEKTKAPKATSGQYHEVEDTNKYSTVAQIVAEGAHEESKTECDFGKAKEHETISCLLAELVGKVSRLEAHDRRLLDNTYNFEAKPPSNPETQHEEIKVVIMEKVENPMQENCGDYGSSFDPKPVKSLKPQPCQLNVNASIYNETKQCTFPKHDETQGRNTSTGNLSGATSMIVKKSVPDQSIVCRKTRDVEIHPEVGAVLEKLRNDVERLLDLDKSSEQRCTDLKINERIEILGSTKYGFAANNDDETRVVGSGDNVKIPVLFVNNKPEESLCASEDDNCRNVVEINTGSGNDVAQPADDVPGNVDGKYCWRKPVVIETNKPERPTSLLYSKWGNNPMKKLAYIRDLSTNVFTPIDDTNGADVFSEETEMALESAFHRQNSFLLRRHLVVKVDEESDDFNLQDTPTNSFALTDDEIGASWLKCRSLPTNLEPDFTGFNHGYNVESESDNFSSLNSSQENITTNNRDSTISRVSATSSGTVVASDDDEKSHVTSMSSDPLLCSAAKTQIVRSKSFDPQLEISGLTPTEIISSTKHTRALGGGMRSSVGVAVSAPTITIATDERRFLTPEDALSSTLYKNASLPMANKWEAESSKSSSSSPTSSPQLKAKGKFKELQNKETITAERQASEACKWLRAAGFPQYVHLYEVGSFPVDISSVSADHDFLATEHIAALVRRLNILNKCANMKLDKSGVKDVQTDDDDDDDEQCAISEFWHFEEDGRRWSRLDSKGGEIMRKPSTISTKLFPHVEEDSGDVFDSEDRLSSTGSEDLPSVQRPIIDGSSKRTKLPVKSKSNSFLRRVDLRKFRPSSFRRQHRSGSVDGEPKTSGKIHPLSDGRGKRGKTIVISDPILKSGKEKIDNMKCLPIENSLINGLNSKQNGRKNSSQSLISSSSSSGSGAASTASTPVARLRSFTEDATVRSDAGEVASSSLRIFTRPESNKQRSQTSPDPEVAVFLMPKDHVPGKFPSAIRELGSDEDVLSGGNESESGDRRSQRPVSIYDNLPESVLSGAASAQDLMNILDPSAPSVDDSGVFVSGSQESLDVGNPVNADAAFWSVDDIVERTHSLQQMVRSWEEEDKQDQSDVSSIHNQQDVLPSYSSENISSTEDEVLPKKLINSERKVMLRQARLRWKSFNRDHRPGSQSQQVLQLHNLSVGQLMILRRLSMLKLTALLESYASNTTKGSLSWSVPRFIRRIKVPDYKDKAVFGVPLLHNVKRFGQPLPQCIQHAFAFLRRTALDQVGLFRKPGVRSRIQRLRTSCEKNPLLSNFEECSSYDVADMVKQFFRELPDPLMTMKLSETFIGIFLYVPKELWLQTLQAAVMLLPDETRETLKTLLCFLSDVSSRSDENHMNETNLATCFAPSLFYQQFGNFKNPSSSSPKVRKQQASKSAGNLSFGRPDMKEMNENAASNNCLAFMIRHVREMFKISEDAMTQCRMSVMQQNEDVLADEIGYTPDMGDEVDYFTDFNAYVDRIVAQTLREEQRVSQSKGGWQSVPSATGCELMFKKMNDDNPLRMWRCQVEIEGAEVTQIADRILNERHLWDEDLLQWKVLQQPDDKTQLFQTVRAEMSPHPTRDYCVLRSWRENTNPRGAYVIVEASTSQPNLLGDVRGVVLTSRYVIEPTDKPSNCLLTHICRVDTKGRNPEWYNKAYGHIECQLLLRVRDSINLMLPKKS